MEKDIYGFIQSDTNAIQKAGMGIKKAKQIEKNNYIKKEKDFNAQHEKFLDMRRKKLSEILMDETKNYHQKLIENMDTSEIVRKRMEQQLMEFKNEIQQKTDDHVNKLLEKKFYDEAD